MGYFPRVKGHGGRVRGVSYPRPHPSPKQIRHSRHAAWKDGRTAGLKAILAHYHDWIDHEDPAIEEYRAALTAELTTRLRAARIANGLQAAIDHLRAAGGKRKSARAAITKNILKELEGGTVTPDEAVAAFLDTLIGYEGRAASIDAILEAFVRGAQSAESEDPLVRQFFRVSKAMK
jgi:hypothetical protein